MKISQKLVKKGINSTPGELYYLHRKRLSSDIHVKHGHTDWKGKAAILLLNNQMTKQKIVHVKTWKVDQPVREVHVEVKKVEQPVRYVQVDYVKD